jgi:hypothetical protein
MLVLGALMASLGACAAPPALERPPWQGNKAGSNAWTGKFGLFTFYEADSTLTVSSPSTGEALIEAPLKTEMIGRFGLGGGYQRFIRDDLALVVGVEGRYTEPVVVDSPQTKGGQDLFVPEDVLQSQVSIGARWWPPVRWAQSGRLRPFVGLDLNFIPGTKFDVLARLNDSIEIPFEFSGSEYWSLGLALGLSYQWSDDIVVHLTVSHETALNESMDTTHLAIPGVDPDFVPPYPTTTTVEPSGFIGFMSVSWGF